MKHLTRCSAPRKYITTHLGLTVGLPGLPPRLMYQGSHGMFAQISGAPSVSAWLATALTVSGVDEASSRSTPPRMAVLARSPARVGLDWLSYDLMVTWYVLLPILNPFLYGVVCLILEITQLSGAPNPARGPVSGWIQPIVIALVAPPPDPGLAPLIPELHACRSPPAPITATPAPAARSSPRRLIPPSGLVLSDCPVWSLIRHRSPYQVATQSAGPLCQETPLVSRAWARLRGARLTSPEFRNGGSCCVASFDNRLHLLSYHLHAASRFAAARDLGAETPGVDLAGEACIAECGLMGDRPAAATDGVYRSPCERACIS